MSSQHPAKTWIEISRTAFEHNFYAFQKFVAPSRVMTVVKANAYGHGLQPTVKILEKLAVPWYGVDNVDEALVIRRLGVKRPILILGYTPVMRVADAVRHDVSFVVYNLETVRAAMRASSKRHPARIHLKLETGLTRQGITSDELASFVALINSASNVKVEGVSMHFANIEDTKNSAYAQLQLARFNDMLAWLKQRGIDPPERHTACSAAALLFPETRFSLIRLGISLYGLWSSDKVEEQAVAARLKIKLQPALTWKTVVAQVKRVAKGEPVSYGLTERLERDSLIAVLPIGYSDGFDRVGMSKRGHVLIRGKRCRIVGRVCMNMCMADVTDVPNVKLEDEVVLLGRQKKERVTAEELAELANGTINYEVVSRLNPLIPRIVVE